MLPVDLKPNLLTDEAVETAESAMERLGEAKGPGLIDRDRLERNLLSSQPLCFNLFGHLHATANSLLPWVKTIDADAVRVTRIEVHRATRQASWTLGIRRVRDL